MHQTGVLSTSACAGVYATEVSVHVCGHTLHRECTCARVCAVCSIALGHEGGGVQLVYAWHILLAWRDIFRRRIDKSVICVFSVLDGG